MPSDKHNSRITRARDLISSLINVALSRDVPFHQPQLLQCLHQGAIFVPLWSPILSSQLRKVTICGRHVIASVRDIQIAKAFLTLCLACSVMKRVQHYWNQGIMAFMYRSIRCMFHEHNIILRIFCNDWMDCRDTFYAALCLYCCVTNRT